MFQYDRNHFRTLTMWEGREENKEEIEEFRTHLRTLYPEIDKDPDWIIKKGQEKYGFLPNFQPKK